MGQGGKGEGGTMIKGLAAQLAVEWLHCSKYVLDQIYTQHQTIVGDVISRLCPLDSHHMQLSPYSILTIGNVWAIWWHFELYISGCIARPALILVGCQHHQRLVYNIITPNTSYSSISLVFPSWSTIFLFWVAGWAECLTFAPHFPSPAPPMILLLLVPLFCHCNAPLSPQPWPGSQLFCPPTPPQWGVLTSSSSCFASNPPARVPSWLDSTENWPISIIAVLAFNFHFH